MKKCIKLLALVLACTLIAGMFGGCFKSGGYGKSTPYSNLNSYGFVASTDKYSFFIQPDFDYSGDGNGSFNCSKIYRVDNKKDAEPVAIYTEPANVSYGDSSDNSIAFMAYGGNRLYFCSAQGQDLKVKWVTPDGKKSGTVDLDLVSFIRFAPVCDGSGYYIDAEDPDYTVDPESEEYSYSESCCVFRVDMKSGKASKFQPAFVGENEMLWPLASADGYLYFAKYYTDTEKMDKGIYRAKYGDKKAEGIVEIDPETLADIGCVAVSGNDLWYLSNDELHYVDIGAGKDKLLVSDVDGYLLNTSGDGLVWYPDGNGNICHTDREGNTETAFTDDPDKEAVYFGGNYVYLISTDYELYVAEKDARITPSKPYIAATELEDGTSGDWNYRTNGKYIRITGYTGSDTEVTVPKELDGKKVTMVGFLRLPETVTKLTVPEGVYFVYEVRGDGLKEINLPGSIDVLGEGQDYTFRFCPVLEKVNLNAKMEHWDEILEAYEAMYEGQGIDAAGNANTGYTLICTDGRIVVNY